MLQVIHQLEKKRVPFTFQVQVMNPALWCPNVAALLQQLALDEKPDYELAKLLLYCEHLTDEILGTRTPLAWRWRSAAEEAPGVYEVNTDQAVSHKVVRTWLKSKGYAAASDVRSGRLR
jgi:hypothetical protein